MSIIDFERVSYRYDEDDQESRGREDDLALRNVDLHIDKGSFVAVIGHNGSGKSTLAKHINALYIPTEGRVLVLGMDSSDEENTLAIRSHAGMVFQNPDNQMVTSIVEEDIAFGPENLGVPPEEIRIRVDEALEAVNMSKYATFTPHNLSGGQKQRIAIAGVLAMLPDIVVLDESTAMLDPQGRSEILRIVQQLNQEMGMTIILITHMMEEAALADRVVVVSEGGVAMDGKPEEILRQADQLYALGLEPPFPVRIAMDLRRMLGWGDLPLSNDMDVLADSIAEACKTTAKRGE